MKWFQHQSKAHSDAKLQKVLMKYGFEGYGLYWYCIESICGNLEPRLTFELEQDSEILAHIGRMDSRTVEDAMKYMVNIGLFTESAGAIFCRKLARYLGDNLTRNDALKAIIKDEKSGLSQTVSDNLRLSQQEERRGEEKTGHKSKDIGQNRKRFVPPTVEEVAAYVATRDNPIDPDRFIDFYESKGWMVGKNKMKDWQASVRNWEKRNESDKNTGVPTWQRIDERGISGAERTRRAREAQRQRELARKQSDLGCVGEPESRISNQHG